MYFYKEKMLIEKDTKLITNQDMFDTIVRTLEAKCDMSETAKILDYAISTREDIPLISENYYPDVIAAVNPGGSEGIYLDWGLKYKSEFIRLGTFKTLYGDLDRYIIMGQLSGMLIYFSNLYLMLNDKTIKKYAGDNYGKSK